MSKLLALILLVVGIVLIIYGVNASNSIGSGFSKLFTGAPTDKTIWLLIGGVLLAAIGLVRLLRSPKL